MHCNSTGGRSGARLPARRYGKSTRATGSGATASSMARSAGWLRSLPAPGARSNAPGVLTRSRAQQDATGFGEVGDALGGIFDLAAVIRVGGTQQLTAPPL